MLKVHLFGFEEFRQLRIWNIRIDDGVCFNAEAEDMAEIVFRVGIQIQAKTLVEFDSLVRECFFQSVEKLPVRRFLADEDDVFRLQRNSSRPQWIPSSSMPK